MGRFDPIEGTAASVQGYILWDTFGPFLENALQNALLSWDTFGPFVGYLWAVMCGIPLGRFDHILPPSAEKTYLRIEGWGRDDIGDTFGPLALKKRDTFGPLRLKFGIPLGRFAENPPCRTQRGLPSVVVFFYYLNT